MRKKTFAIILFLTLFLFPIFVFAQIAAPEVKVFFSPEDNCQDEIIFYLDRAKSKIAVAMYLITSRHLAQALVKARQRGVDVRMCLDAQQAKESFSKSKYLTKNGIPFKLIGGEGIMHHKFCVIDEKIVITGSYNWTASANSKNDENLLIIESKQIANEYKEEFEKLWSGKKLDYKPILFFRRR